MHLQTLIHYRSATASGEIHCRAHGLHTNDLVLRYVDDLAAAGLLNNPNGLYSLGARIINLDRKMRESGSLPQVRTPELQNLVRSTGGEELISMTNDKQIINIPHERQSSVSISGSATDR